MSGSGRRASDREDGGGGSGVRFYIWGQYKKDKPDAIAGNGGKDDRKGSHSVTSAGCFGFRHIGSIIIQHHLMIPLRLRISGFLSYRDPVELDFDSFDLACISGHNGAGKSSLLDAFTWVLFGEARGKSADIINLNSDVKAAEVALTFKYEGNVFRVQRTLPRNKSTLLEFQVLDEANRRQTLKAERGSRSLRKRPAIRRPALNRHCDWITIPLSMPPSFCRVRPMNSLKKRRVTAKPC